MTTHGEGKRGLLGVVRQDARHHHRHGAGGSGDLTRRATEDHGEKTDEYRTIDSRHGTGAGGDAECQSKRQGDHGGGNAAVEVAAQVIESQAGNCLAEHR